MSNYSSQLESTLQKGKGVVMENLKLEKSDNKGFSLVELLVTIAISSIVFLVIAAFISSGTRSFNKQSASIDMQNELQESSNLAVDALMESTELIIKNESDLIEITTGDFDNPDSKIKPRLICWEKDTNRLYITDENPSSFDRTSEESQGYCVSKYVTDLIITLDEKSYALDPEGGKMYVDGKPVLNEYVILNIKTAVTNGSETRSDQRTIKLRNKLERLVINGVEYCVK